jgi:hypothetical protein
MKVSEHLAAMHTKMEDHHNEMIAAHQSAVKKAQDMEGEDGDDHVKYHNSAIRSHQQMADYHHGAVEECQKAATAIGRTIYTESIANRGGVGSDLSFGDLDGPRSRELRHASKAAGMDDAIAPDRISGILTPIPRAGQRPLEKVAVSLELDNILEAID